MKREIVELTPGKHYDEDKLRFIGWKDPEKKAAPPCVFCGESEKFCTCGLDPWLYFENGKYLGPCPETGVEPVFEGRADL